ncbi:hypothetical protein AB205_0039820, partial [Aquarana catesbeiana]
AKLKKKYGPIWVSTLSHYRMVNIAGPDILETLLKQEGKYPMRATMILWRGHRDLRGHSYGPLSICGVIFETRLGCLRSEVADEIQKLISSVGIMLENEVVIERLPHWTRNWLPYWGRFVEAWDAIFAYGRLQRGEDLGGAYLTHLLTNGKLGLKEVYGIMPEILQAGVDTTSNTLTWALYLLAKHPEIQKTLYEEVVSVIPGDKIPSHEDLARMPLLKAVIKETLRMYPVVPQNGRIITDKEIVLEGYMFPKDTLFVLSHYVLSRDENSFSEPDKFLPQRWLRSSGKNHHPFASIPFGYGVRGCLGRRVAELEMHLALSQLIRQFQLLPDPEMKEAKAKNRVVLVSDIPINLQFIDRQ